MRACAVTAMARMMKVSTKVAERRPVGPWAHCCSEEEMARE
jgi:hypothetical protein